MSQMPLTPKPSPTHPGPMARHAVDPQTRPHPTWPRGPQLLPEGAPDDSGSDAASARACVRRYPLLEEEAGAKAVADVAVAAGPASGRGMPRIDPSQPPMLLLNVLGEYRGFSKIPTDPSQPRFLATPRTSPLIALPS